MDDHQAAKLEAILATLKRALDSAEEAEDKATIIGWLSDDIHTVTKTMVRLGLEPDAVNALEL